MVLLYDILVDTKIMRSQFMHWPDENGENPALADDERAVLHTEQVSEFEFAVTRQG